MSNVWLSVLLVVSSAMIGNLVIYGWGRRRTPGVFYFCLLMMAMILHSFGYAFELLSDTVDSMYFWIKIEYLGISFYPFFIMMFIREYTEEKRVANKYVLTFVFLVNVITLVFVYTNNYHFLFYSSMGLDWSPGFPVLASKKGIWYQIQIGILCLSILYGVLVFCLKLKKTRGNYRIKVAFSLIGVIIPMFTLFLYLFGLGPVYIDLTPFAYFIMSICITIGFIKYDILILTPITYEMIFQSIAEAVLVVDTNGLLVGFNDVSKVFFPSLSTLKIGQDFSLIEELRGHTLDAQNPVHEINGRIYNIKTITKKSHKVSIYVANEITEAEHAKKELELLASVDSLTGLYNRRYFMELVGGHRIFGVFAILDLDHFKDVNDTSGHFEGDSVLRNFGKLIQETFPDHITCRYGGEEFALFLADTNLMQAYKRLEALKDKNDHLNQSHKVTFSAGLAVYEFGSGTVSEALIRADKKLYEAKAEGRNRICL